MKKLLLIGFFVILTLPLVSQNSEHIIIDKGFKSINVSEKISVIKDHNYSIDFANDVFNNFKDSILPFKRVANFHAKTDGWWCKMIVENTESEDKNLVIRIKNSYIHKGEFFKVTDVISQFGVAGSLVPIDERSSNERFLNGKLTISKNSTTIVLIRLKKTALIKLPVELYSETEFHKATQVENLLFGIYFGIFSIAILATIFLAFSLQLKLLYVYAIYLISLGFSIFTLTGYTSRFLITNGYYYIQFLYQDSILLVLITMTFFTIAFLNLEQKMKKYARYLKGVILLYVGWYVSLKILAFLNIIDDHVSIYLYWQYAFIILIFCNFLIAAILNLKYAKKISTLYLLANGSFTLSIIIGLSLEFLSMVNKNIALDFSFVYEASYMAGSLLELFFYSIGIMFYIRKTNKQNIDLKNELLAEKLESQKKLDELKSVVVKDHITLSDKTNIYLSKLLYVKSDEHYLGFYLNDGTNHTVRGKLFKIIEELPPNFVRCHRSYVVNTNYIQQKNAEVLTLTNSQEIPISRSYKNKF